MTALTTLSLYNSNIANTRTMIGADAHVSRETAYFKANIGKVKTSAQFVKDYRLLSYAMTAYGLSDMSYASAFIKKILDGGLASSSSIANKLSDPRFKSLTAAFNFGDFGEQATARSSAISATVANYVEQVMETKAGEADQGAQLGLYFQRMAPHVTSGYEILADKALSQVAETILGIPAPTTSSGVDKTAALIEDRLPLKDLSNATKLRSLVTRFAVMWDAKTGGDTTYSPASQVLNSGSSKSVGAALLLKVNQAYRRL